jgi:hypothetical protein
MISPQAAQVSAKAIPLGSAPRHPPTKVIFVKDKLPDGFMFLPVAIPLAWTCQGFQPMQQTR